MIKYQNISQRPLTFYGVTFNPNEIKSVPGFINHIKMIRVNEPIVSKPKAIIEVEEVKEQKVDKPQKRSYNRKKSNL